MNSPPCGTCADLKACEAGIYKGSCMDGYDCGWNCPPNDSQCLQECGNAVFEDDQGLLTKLRECIKIHCDTAANPAECKKGVELNECQTEYYACSKCAKNCTNKACGPDGCGGQCGSCNQGDVCVNDQCQAVSGCQDGLKCAVECNGNAACIDGCKSNVSADDWTKQEQVMDCVIAECGGLNFSKDCFLYMIYDPTNCGVQYDACVGCPVSNVCTGLNCVSDTCGGLCQCTGGLICDNNLGTCQPCFSDQDCEAPTNECLESKCNSILKCEEQNKSDGTQCSNGQCLSGQCVSDGGAGNCDANGIYVMCPQNINPSEIQVPLYTENGKTKMVLGIDPKYKKPGKITIQFQVQDLISMDEQTTYVTEINSNAQCGSPVFSSNFTDDLNAPPTFEIDFVFAENIFYAFAPFVELPASPWPLATIKLISVSCTNIK